MEKEMIEVNSNDLIQGNYYTIYDTLKKSYKYYLLDLKQWKKHDFAHWFIEVDDNKQKITYFSELHNTKQEVLLHLQKDQLSFYKFYNLD